MNKLKIILREPLEIDEFIVYIDVKTVKKFSQGGYYNIYFESKILDRSKRKTLINFFRN